MINTTLLEAIRKPTPSSAEIITILDKASRWWLNGDRDVADDAEIAIRLLDRAEEFERTLPGTKHVIDALSREAGLYPYLSGDQLVRDMIAREAHRVPGIAGMFFHGEQQRVFQKLLQGKNIVLSAPTSFGKTLLVDALIASKKPNRTVIVVPTIALLEERRRALTLRFPDYQVITQSFQEPNSKCAIIVGTQERILERNDIDKLDLFVIDEFYKLDLTSGDSRAKSLNLLLAKYIDISKQVYLLGPSIEENPLDNRGRANFEFYKTKYSPVTADILMTDPLGTNPETLANILEEQKLSSSLVYCRSPKSTRTVSRELISREVGSGSDRLEQIAEWMREHYHPHWYVADALERGIGIHHGRIPRAMGHLMVQLFNIGEIKTLLCTSSLIEGVNTAAENVMIYDKYVSTRKLDRFTFDNIKGRAGRMFKHFVGKIYLFNEPPEQIYDSLDIPLLKKKGDLSDQSILQLSDDSLSPRNLARKQHLLDLIDVPADILTKFAKFGVHELEKLYQELDELISSGDERLFWSGIGSFVEARDSMEVVWGRIPFEKHGVRSARQFAFFASRLGRSATLREFLEMVATGDDIDESIDLGFNFLKGAEYSFVQPLQLIQEMLQALAPERKDIEYSKFLADLASWGLPGHAKALEEVGVPTPIIRKLLDVIDVQDFDKAVSDVRRIARSNEILSDVERDILSLTLGPN